MLTMKPRFYNKTSHSGLEINISNSYANALLQVMRFTPLIRNLALQHAATACINESCLLCEMGFLFDMLQKAEGSICHATNLLRTLSHHPQGENRLAMEVHITAADELTISQLEHWVF
jgi:PAB-dependent poly(A)-specific ribonuclease subunit 2